MRFAMAMLLVSIITSGCAGSFDAEESIVAEVRAYRGSTPAPTANLTDDQARELPGGFRDAIDVAAQTYSAKKVSLTRDEYETVREILDQAKQSAPQGQFYRIGDVYFDVGFIIL